jgi:hypothetical protein
MPWGSNSVPLQWRAPSRSKKTQLALWRLSCQSPMTKQPTDFGTVHSAGYLRLAGRPGSQG